MSIIKRGMKTAVWLKRSKSFYCEKCNKITLDCIFLFCSEPRAIYYNSIPDSSKQRKNLWLHWKNTLFKRFWWYNDVWCDVLTKFTMKYNNWFWRNVIEFWILKFCWLNFEFRKHRVMLKKEEHFCLLFNCIKMSV